MCTSSRFVGSHSLKPDEHFVVTQPPANILAIFLNHEYEKPKVKFVLKMRTLLKANMFEIKRVSDIACVATRITTEFHVSENGRPVRTANFSRRSKKPKQNFLW